MNQLTTVIIVSQGRPRSLILTLDALRYQTLPEFEVVVVGGPKEQVAIDAAGFSDEVAFAAFQAQNVAAARNVGISVSRGDTVAFLDDDAVPGPGWLENLSSALRSSGAELAAGYVRGPDGINFQFSGEFLLPDASHEQIELVSENRVLEASPGKAVEAMGTNVAYSRVALEASGGFDPTFAYFLDESDLNWRLARAGARAVIVPWAQVVHSLAASARRSEDRVPLSLYDIGRSTRAFLDRHYDGDIDTALKTHRAGHEERLLRHRRAGRLTSGSVAGVLGTFDEGVTADPIFRPFPGSPETAYKSTRLMRCRQEAVRTNCLPIWLGKETLTYTGDGVWTWCKPRLRRAVADCSLSSVPRLLDAQ